MQGVGAEHGASVDHNTDTLSGLAGDPDVAYATVLTQTSPVTRECLPGRQVVAQFEVDSPPDVAWSPGTQDATAGHHVEPSDSSAAAYGSSMASTGMLPLTNSSSSAIQ
jgi:hypothetical protein